MSPGEERKLIEVVNSHAADIQALQAVILGLAAQLYSEQGESGLDYAKEKAIAAANNVGSPFGIRPNRNLINNLFEVAKKS
jgi:hypothetical protein